MPGNQKELSLVVPVYMEAPILKDSLNKIYDFLVGLNLDFVMIISVDESGDDSVRIAKEFSSEHSDVECIIQDRKIGRGFAVREAWKQCYSEYYSFIDVDLATGLHVIQDALELMRKNVADLITASRYIEGAHTKRPPLRSGTSRIYNKLLRMLFREDISDHQCGFKIINQKTKNDVLPQTEEDSWFWDAELLVLSEIQGLRVIEIPVVWIEHKYNNTSLRRLLNDVYLHGTGILRLLDKASRIKATRDKSIDGLKVKRLE